MVSGFESNSTESFWPRGRQARREEKKGSRGGDLYHNQTNKTELKIFLTLRFRVELGIRTLFFLLGRSIATAEFYAVRFRTEGRHDRHGDRHDCRGDGQRQTIVIAE